MRTHALWTIVTGLSLFVCVGCSTTDSGSVFRAQSPENSCGAYQPGYCPDGSCNAEACKDGWFTDKWSRCNVQHYGNSMVPQCGAGTAMPAMVQYPYYAVKGPDCFFHGGK